MSDNFLFKSSKNGYVLLVFGISLYDARQYAKNTHPNLDMRFIGKNQFVSPYITCATTEEQVKLNRMSLEKLIQGE